MKERITGMQDPSLRYPAPDPLLNIIRQHQSSRQMNGQNIELDGARSRHEQPAQLMVLGAIALETGELPVEVKRGGLPASYEDQKRKMIERRRFVAY